MRQRLLMFERERAVMDDLMRRSAFRLELTDDGRGPPAEMPFSGGVSPGRAQGDVELEGHSVMQGQKRIKVEDDQAPSPKRVKVVSLASPLTLAHQS